jgi:hypothetical protein
MGKYARGSKVKGADKEVPACTTENPFSKGMPWELNKPNAIQSPERLSLRDIEAGLSPSSNLEIGRVRWDWL